MHNHASLFPPLFGSCPSRKPAVQEKSAAAEEPEAPPQGDFRNMFAGQQGVEYFVGYGEGNEDKTRKMLERLAVRITKEGEETAEQDNRDIPSGYTYLAQLVGHDIVHSVPATIDVTEAQPPTRNLRTAQLQLDTVYGRGPATSPAAYAVSKKAGELRTRLRLGKCRVEGARPAGGAALDIPRTQCPHLDNLPDRGATEALLADPRNDVSLLLSQLTVLFHLLHNRIEAKLALEDARSGQRDRQQAVRRLVKARKVSAFIFRCIVENDLMPKLLTPASQSRLKKALVSGKFLDDVEDERVLLEFSHAAYRTGHSMVRGTYAVNDSHTFTGVKDIVRFTSSRRPHEMPLSDDWLVQWSRFFGLKGRKPNPSQAIRPAVTPALGVNDLFATQDDEYGGLVLRDLLRGADARQTSVKTLIAKLPSAERKHEFLVDAAKRAERIGQWLRARSSSADDDPGLSKKDIEILSTDPPLLFFILMEAEVIQKGKRLGPVGSMVVGETVYGALYRTKGTIEDDDETMKTLKTVFGSKYPRTMPDLIRHLLSAGDLPGV